MKLKTKLTIAALGLVALGAVIIVSRPQAQAVPQTDPVAEIKPPGVSGGLAAFQKKFDFGTISMASGKVTHRYTIKNLASEPVVLHKLYTSCMCTTAALMQGGQTSEAFGMPGHTPIPAIDAAIKPGEEVLINVVFDPAAHGPAGVGPIARVVTLENDAGEPVELEFSAIVTP